MHEMPDIFDKLALAVSACQMAKEDLVTEHGIGEDLPITLFGWNDSSLSVVAQLQKPYMQIDPEERLKKVHFCSAVLRKGWGVTSFTLVAEGFCSSDPEKTRDMPLDYAFSLPDSPVRECLTFTHMELDQETSLVMIPYKQTVGRKIEWAEPLHQRGAKGLRDAAYPQALLSVLTLDEMDKPEDLSEFYSTLIFGLDVEGFSIQDDF